MKVRLIYIFSNYATIEDTEQEAASKSTAAGRKLNTEGSGHSSSRTRTRLVLSDYPSIRERTLPVEHVGPSTDDKGDRGNGRRRT